MSDSQQIANGFNEYFANIGPNLASKIPDEQTNFTDFLSSAPSPMNSIFLKPTDEKEIIDICSSFKSGTGCGYDDIKPDIIKSIVHLIKTPLCHVFNLSIISGVVPDELKIARVVPIYKAGDSTLCNNYRPISVLPIFSKILEKIIHKRLFGFLDHHNLLHNCQFGFRHNHSSYMALLTAYDKIVSDLDNKLHSMGVFLDLSKAFDTIDHNILLSKLHHYGVRGNAFEWFKNYLMNRTQYVVFKNRKSTFRSVTCGVPQGSVLGPLLFIIFLNDIVYSSNKFTFITFADDTNVIISHQNLSDLINIVNTELENLSVWFKCNKLSLNIDKTNFIMFRNKHGNRRYDDNQLDICINGIKISRVTNTKFLGVIVDESLSWSNHTSNIVNVLSKYCGILYRFKEFLPCKTLFSLYNTLVLPHLSYCNLIWADQNNCHLNTVHLKQKRIMRICSNSQCLEHSPPLFKKFNTLTIYDIHRLTLALFMYNYSQNNLPGTFSDYFIQNRSIHSYPTRNSLLYRPYNFKNDLARNTIRRQGPLHWNSIDQELKNVKSIHIFKKGF